MLAQIDMGVGFAHFAGSHLLMDIFFPLSLTLLVFPPQTHNSWLITQVPSGTGLVTECGCGAAPLFPSSLWPSTPGDGASVGRPSFQPHAPPFPSRVPVLQALRDTSHRCLQSPASMAVGPSRYLRVHSQYHPQHQTRQGHDKAMTRPHGKVRPGPSHQPPPLFFLVFLHVMARVAVSVPPRSHHHRPPPPGRCG